MEDFLAFLDEIGFYALLGIEGKGFERVMVPIARLVMTYQLKVLLGIGSINLVPTKLFRQVALLYPSKFFSVSASNSCTWLLGKAKLIRSPIFTGTSASSLAMKVLPPTVA